jgi:malonyl-CoA O-methyltransferase
MAYLRRPEAGLSIREGYERWASVYDDDGNPLVALEEPRIRALLGPVDGLEVADIGCGTGRHALWLTAQGARVTALDFSPRMLDVARRKPGALGVRFVEHDLREPLPSSSFDRILCCLVLDSLDSPETLLRDMHRLCRPDGFAVVSVMHPAMHLRGAQARYIDPSSGERVLVETFIHQVLDYVSASTRAGFHIDHIDEHRGDPELAGRFPRAERYIGWPMLLVMRLRRD